MNTERNNPMNKIANFFRNLFATKNERLVLEVDSINKRGSKIFMDKLDKSVEELGGFGKSPLIHNEDMHRIIHTQRHFLERENESRMNAEYLENKEEIDSIIDMIAEELTYRASRGEPIDAYFYVPTRLVAHVKKKLQEKRYVVYVRHDVYYKRSLFDILNPFSKSRNLEQLSSINIHLSWDNMIPNSKD